MSYPWSKTTPLLEAAETVLHNGAELSLTATIDGTQWHQEAISLSSILRPEELSGAAFALLRDLPYKDTINAVDAVKCNDQDSLVQVKKARQLFFIVRDLVILTSEGKLNAHSMSLVNACNHLGTITDTKGERGRVESITTITDLQANPPQPQSLKSQEEFLLTVKKRLHIADIDIADTTYKQFHKARRNFRRVTALGTISVAALGLNNYFDFAIRGVARDVLLWPLSVVKQVTTMLQKVVCRLL